MTLIPESKIRLEIAHEGTVTEDNGVVAIQAEMIKRPEDAAMEIQANVTSGSFGIRFDSEVTDRATLTDTTRRKFDILDLSNVQHTIKIVSLANGSTLDFIQVYVIGGR